MSSGFPITLATPIRHQAPLPPSVGTVVIGGGIIGLMTAWFLHRAGVRVILLEKGRMAGEQSGRNWGWVRQQGRDYAELPIMFEALRIWHSFPDTLKTATGFRVGGIAYLARSEAKLKGFHDWLEGAKAYGVDTRALSRAEVAGLVPNAAGWIGGIYTPSDAMAEPERAVPALAAAAAEEGLAIREHCAVRALEVSAGRVTGVLTESGPIRAEQVILAGGAWSSLLLARHGMRIPQLSVLSSVSVTEPLPELTKGCQTDDRFAIRRRADGGYTLTPWSRHDVFTGPDAFRHFFAFLPQWIDEFRATRLRPFAPRGFPDAWTTPRDWSAESPSPFEACRILNPEPDRRALERLRGYFAEAFPAIGRPKVVKSWGGMIDSTPDLLPIIDRMPLPGLILATGMSGHGFGIGPGMGRVVADLALGKTPAAELSPFRLARFGRANHRP